MKEACVFVAVGIVPVWQQGWLALAVGKLYSISSLAPDRVRSVLQHMCFRMNKAGYECCPIVLAQLASNKAHQALRCHADAYLYRISSNDLHDLYGLCEGYSVSDGKKTRMGPPWLLRELMRQILCVCVLRVGLC